MPDYIDLQTWAFLEGLFSAIAGVAANRRNPKGDGGKGTGKKMSRQFATNVTTIYDMSRQFCDIL